MTTPFKWSRPHTPEDVVQWFVDRGFLVIPSESACLDALRRDEFLVYGAVSDDEPGEVKLGVSKNPPKSLSARCSVRRDDLVPRIIHPGGYAGEALLKAAFASYSLGAKEFYANDGIVAAWVSGGWVPPGLW